MAFNSKNLKTDASGVKPVSQIYDPDIDDYDPLTGASLGSNRYGMDMISWGKTTGGVYVPIQVDANGIQQMSLAGSKMTGPTKVASFSYTSFPTASTTFYVSATSVLTRNATKRTLCLVNNLGVGLNANSGIALYDSTIGTSSNVTNSTSLDNVATAAGAKIYFTSEQYPNLALHGDSVLLVIPIGTTAPTTGTLDLWATEVIGS